MTQFHVYYMKPDFFRDGTMGAKWLMRQNMMPTGHNLGQTHVFLREVEASEIENVFTLMQGEVWSPNGEARDLIRSKGLEHTSMSVGDIIADPSTNEVWLVDRTEFLLLERSYIGLEG